jgi:hypothetical protein
MNAMTEFFTWEYLATFAGCVVATGLLTEFLKKIFYALPAQGISYVISLVILVVAQLATGDLTSWSVVALDLINAVVVSLTANGGYDALDSLFGKKDAYSLGDE